MTETGMTHYPFSKLKMAFIDQVTGIFLLMHIATASELPNIVVILADDLGWNDVSFHGGNQIPTPNIDALAYNGIILNSHYSPALCTPSRTAFLTGKNPTSVGMQHSVILSEEPRGIPLTEDLLPQRLKRHGYSTHAVGKWHVGFYQEAFTPTRRGFDSFFGYYNGYQDYFDHTVIDTDDEQEEPDYYPTGYDMRRNLDVDYESAGKYSTDCFTEEAVDIIMNHNDTSEPFFLYLAHLAPHAGNDRDPMQAEKDEIAKFNYIEDENRRMYAAMVSGVDNSVGKVMGALRDSGKLENSIVVFLADNGAPTFGVHANYGSNFPLRGMKATPWEGGVHTAAAIWSPLLKRTNRVSQQLMHMSDWMPTLFAAAGLDLSELGRIDGRNLWEALSNDSPSPRFEVFNNYDEIAAYSSFRNGPWKYIAGSTKTGDEWYGVSGRDDQNSTYSIENVINSETNKVITEFLGSQRKGAGLTAENMNALRDAATIQCSSGKALIDTIFEALATSKDIKLSTNELQSLSRKLQQASDGDFQEMTHCDPYTEKCVFNLELDPCEKINLAKICPSLVQKMDRRLRRLKRSVVKPLNQPADPLSDPKFHNGTWSPWR